VGAGIYRWILFGTGWNFSLVAIVVGYVVGGAVTSGSGDRGGRFYQVLAVFLTYCSLVGISLPEFWDTLATSGQRREARKKTDEKARKEAKTDPGQEAKTKAEAKTKTKPAAADPKKDQPEGVGKKLRPLSALYVFGMRLVVYGIIAGMIFAFPLIVGFHSPISLFIFGVGLWQAWRMNVGGEELITGPFRVRG
jgi:hypothetical protein